MTESLKGWIAYKRIGYRVKSLCIYSINRITCGSDEKHQVIVPNSATPFLLVYLSIIVFFALIYKMPQCGFLEDKKCIALSLGDSFYFSVVTITTLGYGDISPNSGPMKVAVSIQALSGILMIGLFLVWMGYFLSRREAAEIEKVNRAIRDRPLFPTYVKLINVLNDFLTSFDSDQGRPPNSYGWEYGKFGVQTAPSFSVNFDTTRFIAMHGIDSYKSLTGRWDSDISNLIDKLHALVNESTPVIDDLDLLDDLEELYDHADTRNRISPSSIHSGDSSEVVIEKRVKYVKPVLSKAMSIRERLMSKAERRTDGASYRYQQHRRFR